MRSKKYYIFVYSHYYPNGGFNDYLASTDEMPTIDDVVNIITKKYSDLICAIKKDNINADYLDFDIEIEQKEINCDNEQNCFRGYIDRPHEIDYIQIVDINKNIVVDEINVSSNALFKNKMKNLYERERDGDD